MANQRYISTSFWDDEWIQSLDPSEKLLYLYLMTNPLTNIAGVYKITERRISFDTGFNLDTIRHIFAKFQKSGKVFRYKEYIAIPSWPKHQRWEKSSKTRVGIDIVLASLEPEVIKFLVEIRYRYPINEVLIPHTSPIDDPSIPHSSPSNYLDSDSNSDFDLDSDTTRSVCPEVPAEPEPVETAQQAPGVFLFLPCITSKKNPNGTYAVTESDISHYEQTYPALDIRQELREMHAWLIANPTRKKSNVSAFIVNWLKRSQDRYKAGPPQPRDPIPPGMAPSAMRTNDAFKGRKSGKIEF